MSLFRGSLPRGSDADVLIYLRLRFPDVCAKRDYRTMVIGQKNENNDRINNITVDWHISITG